MAKKKKKSPEKKSRAEKKKQIELIKDAVRQIAGGEAEGVVDLLYENSNVNEFIIAKKLRVTINQARNILYKLTEKGIVSFIRKKDKKNGGWYTYFWTLDIGKSLVYLKHKIEKEIENLEHNVASLATKQFYYCLNDDNIEMSEENALLHDFACPECGEILQAKDNTKYIQEMKKKIEEYREKLKIIDAELFEIELKADAKKERKKKAEQRKKKAERDLKRKERAMEKEKELKAKKKKQRERILRKKKKDKKQKKIRKSKKRKR